MTGNQSPFAEFTDSLTTRNLGIASQVIALLKYTFLPNDGDQLSGSTCDSYSGEDALGFWGRSAEDCR